MGSRLRDTVKFLFELFCEVAPGENSLEPYIVKKYPESYKNEEELKNLPKFTFPCKLERSVVQNYSFVLTSVDSKYTFGFCRFDPKANTSLVLLSHLPWHDIFFKLLHYIANLSNGPERSELPFFLEACRIRPPMPGHTLRITYNAGHSAYSCQCPENKLPSIPENININEYFSAVDSKCMAGLWAALLNERRVAIVATKPSRLSACVQAANATLYPMSWQHIFIPILPRHLVDYLNAPMPFLVGVPRSVWDTVRMSDVGDVVVLDIDANEFRSPFHDLENLPPYLVASLKKALSDKHAIGDAISRAFLRALVCLIGGYSDAIRIETGEPITFKPEVFVRTRKNMQPFLREILKSQIFQQFIDERLDLLNSGLGLNDEFEVERMHYADKLNTGSGQKLKQQYKDWAKNVKKEGGVFFKNFKDKANPAVQSAVKSVRQGGRNVKSAVKGFRSKIPKASSRSSSLNTTDDSRLSCGSATPASSSSASSQSSPREPRDPPPVVPLDLLCEMEYLFRNNNMVQKQRRDSLPDNSATLQPSQQDKAKTLSPCPPPRLPVRPHIPSRYPIITTRKLIDTSDAPAPPPRGVANTNHFVSNIMKNDTEKRDFHTTTIKFGEGKDKKKLKLALSTNLSKQAAQSEASNDIKNFIAPTIIPRPFQDNVPRIRNSNIDKSVKESCSEADLIKLDDSLEYFDPLKCKNEKSDKKNSADSALLHEYGLDFSQFGMLDVNPTCSRQGSSSIPQSWTKFNE